MLCTTHNHKSGTCTPFESCLSLQRIFLNKPISPESYSLLVNSQCGFVDDKVYVCCPTEEVTETSVETSKVPASTTAAAPTNESHYPKLFPKPPVCGVDAPNRVLGGSETDIDDYPWTALIEYLNKVSWRAGFYRS